MDSNTTFDQLSPLAKNLWNTLNDLQGSVHLSISEMAFESAMDRKISADRKKAYMEVYRYATQPIYQQQ